MLTFKINYIALIDLHISLTTQDSVVLMNNPAAAEDPIH